MDNCMICKNECEGENLAKDGEPRALICETCRLRINGQKLRIIGVKDGKVLIADDAEPHGGIGSLLPYFAEQMANFPKFVETTPGRRSRRSKPDDYETPFRRRERERREATRGN